MDRARQDTADSRQLGAKGEQTAADFLKQKGYYIRERNYRCKQGEIDLIAEVKEYLVFVEVKTRYASQPKINPLISVTKAKCKKLRLLGKIYLEQKRIKDRQPRFDVVGITFQSDKDFQLEHIENAF